MVAASRIAEFLGAELRGPDIEIERARSLQSLEVNSVIFFRKAEPGLIEQLNVLGQVLCITTGSLAERLKCSAIPVDDPRYAFALMLGYFFDPASQCEISPNCVIEEGALIGDNVAIGPGSHISAQTSIGANTRIGSNVVVAGRVSIGKDCIIKSNTTIGEPGFGFVRDEGNRPVRFPHIGGVSIGDNVEIGSNCTVVQAALDMTIVEDFVKTDDHVHIAHNCKVGFGTFIAAGSIISGSVEIGKNCWLAPNSTIIDKCRIGEGAFVGLGSAVRKPVADHTTVFGVPASPIRLRPAKRRG